MVFFALWTVPTPLHSLPPAPAFISARYSSSSATCRFKLSAAGAVNENQSHFLDIVKNNIDRLVIDSLSAMGLSYRSLRDLREELFLFSRFLHQTGVTSLLITESLENAGLTRWGFEQFIADSFVHLGMEETKGELRRTITVRKMRFTKHDTVKHPLRITGKGIVVEADERVV